MNSAETLDLGLAGLGLHLASDRTAKLLAYVELLGKWNRTYNLTAIREPERMVSHHLIDSLAVLPHLPAGSLVDIGTGGGLPGIPLAIADPERVVMLNDSNHKKGAFLKQAVIELALPNVSLHIGRAEDWQPAELFDVAISRAFSELGDFVAASRHLVRPRGYFVALKGLYPHDEVLKIPAGVRMESTVKLSVPMVDGDRHLIICRDER